MNIEQKVDSIEGEMALVKGEIKQTLVDLREFIMKQGSPFMVGGEGGDGAIAQGVIDQMLEQAQAVAREEASTGLQRGLRLLEAIQAQVAMAPGASDEVMAEIEELRRQGREQADASRRQLEGIQAQPSQTGADDTAELRRQIESLRAQQASAPSATAAADLQRQMDEMQQRQMAMQSQAAAQTTPAAAPPPVLGAQVVQAPPGAPPQAQVIQVQPAPQQQEQAPATVLQVELPPAPPQQAEQATLPAQPAEHAQAVQVDVPIAMPENLPMAAVVEPLTPQFEPTTPQFEPTTPPAPEPVPPAATGAAPGLAAQPPRVVSPLAEQLEGSAALDANLLASLVRWVGGIKRRLGADQLPGFIEMYKLTGHLPVVVEKLVLHVASLDALPDESADQIFTLDDVMDSLLQLHAIVYGPGHSVRGSLAGLLEEQA